MRGYPVGGCSKLRAAERLKDLSPMVDRLAGGVERREAESLVEA